MPNVVVTPHVASATSRMRPETRRRVGREVALVLKGKWPMSCVNPTVLPRTSLERWQPYPMDSRPEPLNRQLRFALGAHASELDQQQQVV